MWDVHQSCIMKIILPAVTSGTPIRKGIYFTWFRALRRFFINGFFAVDEVLRSWLSPSKTVLSTPELKMIRNKSSMFGDSALKCMVFLLFFLLTTLRFRELEPVKIGCPVSTNRGSISSATEFHFSSGFFTIPRSPTSFFYENFHVMKIISLLVSRSVPGSCRIHQRVYFLCIPWHCSVNTKLIRGVNDSE